MNLASTGVVCLVVVLAGCAPRAGRVVAPAQVTSFQQPEAGLTAEERGWLDGHCPEGAPVPDVTFDHGPTDLAVHRGFAALVSRAHRIPLWVCQHVVDEQLIGPGDRDKSSWKSDMKLPPAARAADADYRGSGFARGHHAPAADFKLDQALTDDSHLFSNAAPQEGPKFNSTAWEELESRTRAKIGAAGEAWVITGTFLYDPAEEDPATADGLIEYWTIGTNEVAVPTHWYKIVVFRDGTTWSATTFVMENRPYAKPASGWDYTPYLRTVDWVEAHAGVDFFPDLSPGQAAELESSLGTAW